MAFSSLNLSSCIFTPSPHCHNQANKFVITKSTKVTSSTKRLSFPPQHKPFAHANAIPSISKRSFLQSATTENVTAETKTSTEEQWKIEREALSQQIESLELQVQQLTSESSSPNTPVDGFLDAFNSISSKLEQFALSDDGLVVVDPKPNPGECSESVDELVQNTYKFYDPFGDLTPEQKFKYLKGNFGPIRMETPPTSDIVVEEGQIPENLNGMMLRNGPNPKHDPEGSYMWMDGDSMIHGLRFKDGKATYVARYTQTSRLMQHDEFQKTQGFAYGDLYGEYGLFATYVDILRTKLNILDKRFGISTANTGLIYHGQRIMALEDFGEPYVIHVTEDGDLETLGINTYNGKLDHWLSPHPKVDPVTGDMFNIGSLQKPPYCIYRVVSKDGVISDPVPITTKLPTYMHEVCITENYAIIQDLPLVYDPENMKSTDAWIFNFDDTMRPRYGIIPRYATSEADIKWFEFDGSFYVFHNANAWEEEDGTVVLYCCNMEAQTNAKSGKSFISPLNFQIYDDISTFAFDVSIPQLYKMTFNMKTGEHTKELVDREFFGDWPKINTAYTGRKTQYLYLGEVDAANKIPSVAKFDLNQQDGNPKRFTFPTDAAPHTYGGEVVFAPKGDHKSTLEEDDGYLITFVHKEDSEDSSTGTSYAYVIDAKTMESVAKLRLPVRVPYGYHAIYVTEEELQNQIRPST